MWSQKNVSLQLKWVGHVARLDDSHLMHHMLRYRCLEWWRYQQDWIELGFAFAETGHRGSLSRPLANGADRSNQLFGNSCSPQCHGGPSLNIQMSGTTVHLSGRNSADLILEYFILYLFGHRTLRGIITTTTTHVDHVDTEMYPSYARTHTHIPRPIAQN